MWLVWLLQDVGKEITLVRDELARVSSVASRVAVNTRVKDEGMVTVNKHVADVRALQVQHGYGTSRATELLP